MNSPALSAVSSEKTFTSAPPVNTPPSARIRSALTPSPSASPMAATTSVVSSRPNRLSGGSSITPTPTSPWRSKRARASATKLIGDLGELLLVGLLGPGGQLQRVVVVARDHVDVEVEHRLPRGGLGGVEQVDPGAAQAIAHPLRE